MLDTGDESHNHSSRLLGTIDLLQIVRINNSSQLDESSLEHKLELFFATSGTKKYSISPLLIRVMR